MKTEVLKKYNRWVIVLSILIPLVVGSLFRVKLNINIPVFLPPVYATINALTGILLLMALWAVKTKRIALHKKLMISCVGLSALFLVLYVLYHMTSDATKYGGDGLMKTVYFVLLISHIVLSVVVIPFVLITFLRGLSNQIVLHKKIARYSFPLWFYVTLSGVLVYILISPYYI